MTDPATDAAKRAAVLFAKRDKLVAELAVLDSEIKRITMTYREATRVWGFTPMMLRRECKLKGLTS
jgi:hypothetical protein